jgi:hypothetical protein
VGDNYWCGFEGGPRLLILGESHYDDDDPDKSLTQRLTREYAEGKWRHRFWTMTMQVVAGRDKTEIDRMRFWQSVAFYNFIQEFVGSRPRTRPSAEAWLSANHPFEAVLEALRPQALLVLGVALWDNLPNLGGREGPMLRARELPPRESWVYPLPESSKVLATPINHPSSGIGWETWHPIVAALLDAAAA